MPIAFSLLPGLQEGKTAGPDLTRYMLVCVGLLVAILVLAFLFKRFLAGAVQRKAAKRSLRVVDVLPLGGKQKLVVVRCYDRSFLLGMGEKEISSIAELDAAEGAFEEINGEEGTVARPTRPSTGQESPAVAVGSNPLEQDPGAFRRELEEAVAAEERVPAPLPRSGESEQPETSWDGGGILA